MTSCFLLSLLPDELWTYLLNEWLENVFDWCSFDSALCQRAFRKRFIALPFKVLNNTLTIKRTNVDISKVTETLQSMCHWKTTRNIKIKGLMTFLPLLSFLPWEDISDLEELQTDCPDVTVDSSYFKRAEAKLFYPNHGKFRSIINEDSILDMNLLFECAPKLLTAHIRASTFFNFRCVDSIRNHTQHPLRRLECREFYMKSHEYEYLLRSLEDHCPFLEKLGFTWCDGMTLDVVLRSMIHFPKLKALTYRMRPGKGRGETSKLGNNDNASVDIQDMLTTHFPTLTPFLALQTLELGAVSSVSNLVLLLFSLCPSLRSLHMNGEQQFAPCRLEQCLTIFTQNKIQLHAFKLSNCYPKIWFVDHHLPLFSHVTCITLCGINDEVLLTIRNCMPRLEKMWISESCLTSQVMRQFAESATCMPLLQVVDLCQVQDLTAEGVVFFLQRTVTLKSFHVYSNLPFDIYTMLEAMMTLPSLRKLQTLFLWSHQSYSFNYAPERMDGWLDRMSTAWNLPSLESIYISELCLDKRLLTHIFNNSPLLRSVFFRTCYVPWKRHVRDGGTDDDDGHVTHRNKKFAVLDFCLPHGYKTGFMELLQYSYN
jgi:hypothetical protein